MSVARGAGAAVVMALLTAACGSAAGGAGTGHDGAAHADDEVSCRVAELVDTPDGVPVDQPTPSPPEPVVRAVDDPTDPRLPTPLVDPAELVPLGTRDGIAPIDDPRFVPATDIRFLAPCEAVLVVELNGDVRAYPVQILVWHEIVNDTVGGVPLAVTYCPLCNSAVAVERTVDGRILDFSTSGWVRNSALVMYDRQTGTLWDHFVGEAIIGDLTGTRLVRHAVQTVSFAQLLAVHPDARVLTRDTGARRSYGLNPYRFYDETATAFGFSGIAPGPYAEKEHFVGVALGDDAVAVRLEGLLAGGVVHLDVAGVPVVVWATPGVASPLSGQLTNAGREVGATGVFEARVGARRLHFERRRDRFVDRESGSTWTVTGTAVAGPLAGSRLTPVEHLDTFWFAWTAFHPGTRVVDP